MSHQTFAPPVSLPCLEVLEPRLLLSAVAELAAPVFLSDPSISLLAADPPQVTGISSKYDGNADPTVLGRYIGGVSVLEKFSAKVHAAGGDPVTSVTFTVGGQEFVDSNGSDGWSFAFDVGTLSATAALTVTAAARSGATSDAYAGQVQVIPMPAWVADTGAAVTFSAGKKSYLFHCDKVLLEKSITVPSDYVLLGDLSSSVREGMAMDLVVATSPAKAVKSTITANQLIVMLGKTICSRSWKASATYDPKADFNAQLTLDSGSLDITDLVGTLAWTKSIHTSGSLAKCPVAAYFGVSGNLSMDIDADVAVSFGYAAGEGIVLADPTHLAVTGAVTLKGSVNTTRPSLWPPILKWGISGSVQGTVSFDLNATYTGPGPADWTAPFSAHIWCQLNENDPVEFFLHQALGWDTLTPDLLKVTTDLAATA
jgi:hypothetical protein